MRQRREFNARRGNPTRHIPERWIPETAGNLITRHVKLIEQLEGRFNGETKQTHRYRLYPTWNSSIRGNQLYSIYHLQKSFNEFTVILDVPIKLNSNKAKWKVKEKKKRKKGSWKFGLWKVSKRMYSVKIEDLSLIFEIIFTLLVTRTWVIRRIYRFLIFSFGKNTLETSREERKYFENASRSESF